MKKCLSSNGLKFIAVVAMVFDHLLWVLKPGYDNCLSLLFLHVVGRVVAPIFCFFVAEGAFYTRNRERYFARLLCFSLVSHFAYCFAFGICYLPFANGTPFNQTSIMWSLSLGLVGIMVQDSRLKDSSKTVLTLLLCLLGFPSDWSSVAVMIIVYDYHFRGDFKSQMACQTILSAVYALVYCIFIDVRYGIIQMCTILSIPLLAMYNGQRGRCRGFKWFFYLVYPAHLVLCGLLRLHLYGDVPVMIGG